jgi:hypothetical protein
MTSTEHASSPAPSGTALAAVSAGWARVRAHWPQVAVAYLLSIVLALPLAAALGSGLHQSLQHREAAERMLHGWDGLWHRSFAAQAQGLHATFDAGIVGIGAVLRSLDALAQGSLLALPAPILVAGLLYLAGWVLLGGGLLARFGGDPRGVLQLGALHFRRMLALAAVGWLLWALVLGLLLPALGEWVELRCRDVIDERIHAAWILGKYALVWLVVLAIRVVIDYAKVAAIDDPSRSTFAALRDGLGVCRRRAGAVLGVAVILGALGLALLLVSWAIAPGAGHHNGFQILVAFVISQTSVMARVGLRALALASEQALWRDAR